MIPSAFTALHAVQQRASIGTDEMRFSMRALVYHGPRDVSVEAVGYQAHDHEEHERPGMTIHP
jgi:hypothetical protein